MIGAPRHITDSTCNETKSPTLRILVVDDNVDAADSLGVLLRASGHEVETVYDGPTVLAAARECRPNLILLDIALPRMNGFEIAKRIREDVELCHVVLVAVTGYGQEADKRRSKEVGFDHHLLKPADFNEVEQILATVLANSKAGHSPK